MRGAVRVGDRLENGGTVLGGSNAMVFMGRGVARQGDPARCNAHGDTYIAEGDRVFTDKGKPIALHLHKCACGCRLISSLQMAGKG
jgi:uncharacterized Zn-binding protein involved in type VI secretion